MDDEEMMYAHAKTEQVISAQYFFARMDASGAGCSRLSETEETLEKDPSMDKRWRPRPKTRICAGRGGSVARPPPSGVRTHLRIRDIRDFGEGVLFSRRKQRARQRVMVEDQLRRAAPPSAYGCSVATSV
jgi:hypothetical protein